MAPPRDTVAFIGLGVMGYPMAANLRRKLGSEKSIVVCDAVKASVDRFEEQFSGKGPVEVVANGYEAAKAADVVITMLPHAEAVKSVYQDPKTGIFAALREQSASGVDISQKLIMECGTISQPTISDMYEEAKSCGVNFIDAPVSGGPMGSEAGTLSFMIGCKDEDLERIKTLLVHMGKEDSLFHCGEVGAGTAFKIINNYISIISILSVSEALNIGAKMGLNMKTLVDLINSSSGQCWVSSKNNPVPGIHPDAPASKGYVGGFRLEMAMKVLDLGKELAEMVGAQTYLDKTALRAFAEAASDSRYAGKDARVVYKWLNEYE